MSVFPTSLASLRSLEGVLPCTEAWLQAQRWRSTRKLDTALQEELLKHQRN